MVYMIIGLVLLGVVALVAELIREQRLKGQLKRGEISELPTLKQVQDMECCGQHAVCEKEKLLEALSKEVEYYDDEELDRFQGRASDDYTSEETEEFRNVLYTMREGEVSGWTRSLQLRGVELPNALKDEVLMMLGDERE